jgi:hypothetical protein
MPRIHALLVGINEYVAVGKLHGCVADVTAVEALLQAKVPPEQLNLRVLRDAEATRAAIIDGFRSHLTQAKDGDIALFYYCGHGSEEPCPPEWRMLEPSGRNQTLVSVDARVGEVFDLADKELSALIHEVASSGAQVVTLFDSCHSGGVTRSVGGDGMDAGDGVARMIPASGGRTRTLADYLDAARVLFDPERVLHEGPPDPPHLAIAACQSDQLAKEFPKQPPRRGAFTQALELAIATLGPSATYIDLVNAIRATVRSRATDQLPNLSAVGGANAATLFLGGTVGRRDLTVDVDDKGAWWLSAGAITGIPELTPGSATQVAVYRRGAFDDAAASSTPVTTATIDLVLGDRSRLAFGAGAATLDRALAYVGTVTSTTTAPLNVLVQGGPAEQVSAVTAALQRRRGEFALIDAAGGSVPTVTVMVDATGSTIHGTDGAPLPRQTFAHDEFGLQSLADACVHLARWHGTRDRRPLMSRFNDVVILDVIPMAPGETQVPPDRAPLPVVTGGVTVQYTGETAPLVHFRLRNTSATKLWVAVVSLTDSFACNVCFSDAIPAGGSAILNGSVVKRLLIPAWRDPSYRVATDLYKVFAADAKEQFSVDRLALPSLLNPKPGGVFREAEDIEEPDTSFWGTSMLRVEIRR